MKTRVQIQEAHELNEELEIRESERGTVLDHVLLIVFLVVGTVGAMILTGASTLAESGQSFDILRSLKIPMLKIHWYMVD